MTKTMSLSAVNGHISRPERRAIIHRFKEDNIVLTVSANSYKRLTLTVQCSLWLISRTATDDLITCQQTIIVNRGRTDQCRSRLNTC